MQTKSTPTGLPTGIFPLLGEAPGRDGGLDAAAIGRELTVRQREHIIGVSDGLHDSTKREMAELRTTQALLGVYRAVFPDRKPPEHVAVIENKPPATGPQH
jgi:hypothetical protein